jgi:hypothetical protein
MNAERHCSLKIPVRLDDLRGVWGDATDKQRIEIIKSIIWSAEGRNDFGLEVSALLNSKKFCDTID